MSSGRPDDQRRTAGEGEELGSSTSIALPRVAELDRKLAEGKLPFDWGRRLAALVTGTGTLVLGTATLGVLWGLVRGALQGLMGPIEAALVFLLLLVMMGGMTAGLAFLTWRWGRDLPPAAALATEREKQELLS